MNATTRMMPWFTREEFPKIMALHEDADKKSLSFDLWFQAADKLAKIEESAGVIVCKVYIESDALLTFSIAGHHTINEDIIGEFAGRKYAGISNEIA